MRAQLPLEIGQACRIAGRIVCARQNLQPDRVLSQPPQAKHPLQRDRKVAAALEVFSRETATDENGHKGRRIRPTLNLQLSKFSMPDGTAAIAERL